MTGMSGSILRGRGRMEAAEYAAEPGHMPVNKKI